MRNRTSNNSQRRRRAARKASGQISIVPLYVITMLACLCVFAAICMNIDTDSNRRYDDEPRFNQASATQAADRSHDIESNGTLRDRDAIEELMRKRARLIQSHRAKGVEIAMVAPSDLQD